MVRIDEEPHAVDVEEEILEDVAEHVVVEDDNKVGEVITPPLQNPFPQQQQQQDQKQQGCCQRFGDRNPRLIAFIFGIIIPLSALVALSCIFGYWLAHMESPIEIQQNDQILASYTLNIQRLQILSNLSSASPKICFNLFLSNVTTEMLMTSSSLLDLLYEGIPNVDDDGDISNSNDDGSTSSIEKLRQITARYDFNTEDTVQEIYHENNGTGDYSDINIIDLYYFLKICGDQFRFYINNITGLTSQQQLPVGQQFEWNNDYNGDTTPAAPSTQPQFPVLDFSWNRCTPYSFLSDDRINFTHSLRPINQTKYYINTWKNDTIRIYNYYYKYYTITENLTSEIASVIAEQLSVVEASGGLACDVNIFAGAWFWFTIMSTIGYGNAAIETISGRVLIYTFGFLSLLLFGGVSLCAGGVTVAIFKDTCNRWNASFLTAPWLATIIWGALYYTWMCVIANFYVDWNANRLGFDDVRFRDGYWFAYISTTTIGLGDFVLNPAVLVATDMIFWPFIFLLGFVLLSAFIQNLSAVVMKPVHAHSERLAQRLEETRIFYGNPMTHNHGTHNHDSDVYDEGRMDDRPSNLEESALHSTESSVPTQQLFNEANERN